MVGEDDGGDKFLPHNSYTLPVYILNDLVHVFPLELKNENINEIRYNKKRI
jgi:hypothetical protein|tara:strand:+ start:238 stop:390 length:153 start_codon:yes stop_codon:yes gene_type:complete